MRLKSSSRSSAGFPIDLTTSLIALGDRDRFSLGEAFQGIQIFGGTGSGKTSGSGRTLAHAFLKHGFGGLILCAKPTEADLWQRYAERAGRASSVLRVGADTPWTLNFLDYILAKEGAEGANNAVHVLLRAAEASRLARDKPSNEGGTFWEDATRQLLMSTVPLLFAAQGRVTLGDIYRFIQSAPQSEDEAISEKWQTSSFCCATMRSAHDAPTQAIGPQTFDACMRYWRYDFARLDPKTRANVVITLTSLLGRFAHGRLHDLLCSRTTFVPDLCFEGVLLILDMPVKTWHEDGIIAQHIIKYLWQRAVESRAASMPSDQLRPVFLWADESQFFINSYDPEFQSTARSARAATVYITQSLPTYYAKIGGVNPTHYADMLLANLMTKIFHANGCHVTNLWAAETIGKALQLRSSFTRGSSSGGSDSGSLGYNLGHSSGRSSGSSYSSGPHGGSSGGNWSTNSGSNEGWQRGRNRGASWNESEGESLQEQKDYKLDPAHFADGMHTGGAAARGRVDAIWMQPGRRFSFTNSNFSPVIFRQDGVS